MLELPTIKTDFLFENSQDFNQTTHARPQYPIVFIHNISLYFNCISSVNYLFKWPCHGHVMPFSSVWPKHKPKKIEYAYFERQEKCLHVVQNASCWPLCGEVICISNLRNTYLRCILSPSSFQFFKNFQKQWWRKV